MNSVLPVLPGSTWWVRLLASSTDTDLRGELWLSEPTLSRPPAPPTGLVGMTMAILFVIVTDVARKSAQSWSGLYILGPSGEIRQGGGIERMF